MSERPPAAVRRARVAVVAFVVLGVIQGLLLSVGIGNDPAIRWGLGIPLVLAVLVSAGGYILLRRRVPA